MSDDVIPLSYKQWRNCIEEESQKGRWGRMTEQLPEGKPPARQAGVVSSFAAFLPPEYQSGFSSDWLMGLSPFEDRTCSFCYSVKEGRWVAFGPKKADERLLICQRTG